MPVKQNFQTKIGNTTPDLVWGYHKTHSNTKTSHSALRLMVVSAVYLTLKLIKCYGIQELALTLIHNGVMKKS